MIKHIHFVGIGGSGMSGIAEVLLNQGYVISGSDLNVSVVTKRLQDLGIQVFIGHKASNVINADVVVVSTAVTEANPEVKAAHKYHIPVLRRAQMLGELMRLQQGIAIAGTHGKTTVTSLVASLLTEGGLDPTFVIGGLLNSAGTHAKLGNSRFFVAEADESDASFLYLQPKMAVVTNIDIDHMQTYKNDINCLHKTFLDFLHRLPLSGLAVVCIDDPIIRDILPKIARSLITYGFSDDADVQAIDFQQIGTQSTFKVKRKANQTELPVILNLPGKHNALNALAAMAIATECGVKDAAICQALTRFQGVGRRFQIYGKLNFNSKQVTLIDDYGHHPLEISVTLQAIRDAWPKKRIVLAFQPHRYTRTQDLFDDFVATLSQADQLILLEIYPASEKPIPGVTSRSLLDAITTKSQLKPQLVENIENLPMALAGIVQDGDILLLQGAGSIGDMAAQLGKRCKQDG